MHLLYDDKLAPMTSELGFLETDVEKAIANYAEWNIGLGHKWFCLCQQPSLNLAFAAANVDGRKAR